MTRWRIIGLLLCAGAGGAALAQVSFPPIDPSAFDTPAQRDAAIQANIPSDCPAPGPDGLTATAGIMARCMPRVDRQRATQVQATTVVTAADGTFSGNWPAPFASTPTGRIADIEISAGATTPYKCSFSTGAVTATAFAGKCWQIVATTLPTTAAALGGLVISPVQNAAGNLTVRVVGRQ